MAGPVAEIVGPAIGKIAGKIKNSAGDIYRSSVGMGSKSSKATLKKAAGAMDNKFIGGQRAIQDFADEVNPDFNAINAIRELELENYATPGMISNNPAVRALDNAVASLPGTEISEAHKRFITELGRKADEMITSFGEALISNWFLTGLQIILIKPFHHYKISQITSTTKLPKRFR